MNKERLIELRNKLERKYISYDGSDTLYEITQYELEQRKNEDGAVSNLEKYYERLITKLELNGKMFDELMISAVYKLFYKKEDIDSEMGIPYMGAKPLKDYIIISFGCYKAINGDEQYHSDPEDIYSECYDEFIVSFDEFKTALEKRGYDIGTITSFDEIEEIIKNERIPVTFFSKRFSNAKKIVKE